MSDRQDGRPPRDGRMDLGDGPGRKSGGGLLDLPLGDQAPLGAPPAKSPPGRPPVPPAEPRRRRWPLVLLLLVALATAIWLWPKGPPAELATASPGLDFGEVIVGGEGERRQLPVTNSGGRRLPPITAAVGGEARAEFGLDAGDCEARRLRGGERCLLELTAWPLEEGSRSATLELRAGEAEPLSVELTATAATLDLRPDRPTVRFRRLEVGDRSGAETVLFRNAGTGTARGVRVELRGSSATAFVTELDRCTSAEIAPGESCRLELRAAPDVAGDLIADLVVVASGVDSSAARLRGEAVARAPLTFDPSRVDFGAITVGLASQPVPIRVTNRTTGTVQPARVALAAGSPFQLVEDECSGRELASRASCSLAIAFAPREERELSVELELEHPSLEGRSRLPLVGQGVIPVLAFAPDPVDFGAQPLGGRRARREVELANRGPGVAMLGATSLTDSAYAVLSDGCSAGELAVGQSCSLALEFRPTAARAIEATLEVAVEAPASTRTVRLRGTGVEARLQLDRERIDFGQVAWGARTITRLLLSNAGNAPLALEALDLSGPAAADVELTPGSCEPPVELSPKSSCSLDLAFRSTAEGERRAELVVAHGGDRRRRVPIRARVGAQPLPRVEVSPAALGFGEVAVGGRSAIETISLRNSGTARLQIVGVRVEGDHAEDFRLVPGSCEGLAHLAAGSSCTIGVRFVPVTGGGRRGRLLIRHDGSGRRTVVGLEGLGRAGE